MSGHEQQTNKQTGGQLSAHAINCHLSFGRQSGDRFGLEIDQPTKRSADIVIHTSAHVLLLAASALFRCRALADFFLFFLGRQTSFFLVVFFDGSQNSKKPMESLIDLFAPID